LVRSGGRFAALSKAQFMTVETQPQQDVSQPVET
jgi:hypothetical protein